MSNNIKSQKENFQFYQLYFPKYNIKNNIKVEIIKK